MPKQPWWCEDCKAEGEVEYYEGAGVWEVVQAIRDDHESKSPQCEVSYTCLRLGSKEDGEEETNDQGGQAGQG